MTNKRENLFLFDDLENPLEEKENKDQENLNIFELDEFAFDEMNIMWMYRKRQLFRYF